MTTLRYLISYIIISVLVAGISHATTITIDRTITITPDNPNLYNFTGIEPITTGAQISTNAHGVTSILIHDPSSAILSFYYGLNARGTELSPCLFSLNEKQERNILTYTGEACKYLSVQE